MAPALEPVSDALVETALEHAGQLRDMATEQARTELAAAHAEAERLVAQARAEGAEAADWIASLQLAEARREARETVLEARRRAYETLRRQAIEALDRRATTPEGRLLAERLSALVRGRLGPDASQVETSVRGTGHDGLALEAQSGNRRAAIGPRLLVDHVLLSMSKEIEELWA